MTDLYTLLSDRPRTTNELTAILHITRQAVQQQLTALDERLAGTDRRCVPLLVHGHRCAIYGIVASKRRCAAPGCGVALGHTNTGRLCRHHQPDNALDAIILALEADCADLPEAAGQQVLGVGA